MKDDGTVEFEVPGDVEPPAPEIRSKHVDNEFADVEPLDPGDLQYIPPLQIVMLIVGTRGDVQPFVAIGKRLQVMSLSSFYMLMHTYRHTHKHMYAFSFSYEKTLRDSVTHGHFFMPTVDFVQFLLG